MVVPSSSMAFDDWFLESPNTDLDPILQLSRRMWSTCARFPGTSWSCWWRASSWTSNRGPSNSNSTKKLSTRPSKNATLEIWRKLAASSRIVSKKKVIPSSWLAILKANLFVRSPNKGTQLFSTLSYNKAQLPWPSQVSLLLGPLWTGSKSFILIRTIYVSSITF